MKSFVSFLLSGMVATCLVASVSADDGFKPIFDGKSLEGWDGNPDFWSVEEGAITGITTKEKPTKGNTFIIWRGGELGDFTLSCEYKIVGGNSGIQYRSFEVPDHKWVIGGYQADIDAAPTGGFTGICYGERFRGILAGRGKKSVIGEDSKPKEEALAGYEDLIPKLNKEGWNKYEITADGFTFTQKINGITTCVLTDDDAKNRKEKGLLALQLHQGPPMKVQFRDIKLKSGKPAAAAVKTGAVEPKTTIQPTAQATQKKKIIFLAGGPSHGFGSHDHPAGCKLLAASLEKHMGYESTVHYRDWPADAAAYAGADCVVMYSDGGGGHPVNKILDTMDAVAKKGTGIVCIHYAVEIPKGKGGDAFLDWTGGYFETHWSVNPHWVAKFEKFPDHPIARGVQPFACDDEWYYHMRFRPEMKNVTPILSALPPKETLTRGDGPHSGNPDVRRDVLEKKEPQHVAWAGEREGGGRGFGFTGGHNHWNWGDENFRKTVLNAIVWCSRGEVPAGGVGDGTVTFEDLMKNPDENVPANFNAKGIIEKFHLKSTGEPVKSGAAAPQPNVKPLAQTKVVTASTPGQAEQLTAEIKGAKELYLVVTDAGDGFGCDWALWAEPKLIGPDGEKKLTELKWKSAEAGHGNVHVNKNNAGKPAGIAGKAVDDCLGTHAVSVIAYELPAGYEKFSARCGLDDGGTKQGCGSTAQFFVYTQNPGTVPASKPSIAAASNAEVHAAENAVAGLEVGEGLEAVLYSSEPQISNITALDIDPAGRVWACEVKNYRKFKGSRPEGDRVLVLEDTDFDGKSDKSTVFYQGNDIDSVHGICVIGNRVILSAGDKIQVFYDDNGDLKSDRKETLFSGIAGTQHDHGIHSMVFGPDGKLYFNFGNSGNQIMDRDGKIVVDTAGNEVKASRKPYQEGMVFRCNLDGSEFETLGWNFRNNWEVCVDSFGTLWQSDNDDDGNKAVRINYVMEFGNYGYKDEISGAGWNTKRTNLEAEIPQRHWHLNDPGVVPTLLITGQGAPTGICIYEGTLLPERFRNQVIHCDAGPNVCRAYPVKKSGAGYTAETENVLRGAKDNWFRPSDACVAPDGSLFVSDWYDPGVGGHNQQEVDKGRIFRVAPPGSKYSVPKIDLTTPEGCLAALVNPASSVRYSAWTALHGMGEKAVAPVKAFIEKAPNARQKAQGLWLLSKLPGQATQAVALAAKDADADIRCVALRLVREAKGEVLYLAKTLAGDTAPEVRRECAIALRAIQSPEAAAVWADLAVKYDGKDRWYLEALGIGAEKNWDACLDAYLKKVGDSWNTPAGRDLVWRSRAKQTPALLAKIIKDAKAEEQPRYFRAFDFLSGPEKEAALKSLLDL